MKKITLKSVTLIIVSTFSISSCASQPIYRTSTTPLDTVSHVDLNKYLGTWYEIYRLPNKFENIDCKNITANYSLREDGNIKVINSCTKTNNKLDQSTGIAKVVDSVTNAKLKVSFFRPFYGDYWIIDLAPDYSWVMVGEPEGKYFWILSRTPTLSANTKSILLAKAKELGYPTQDFIKPKHVALPQ